MGRNILGKLTREGRQKKTQAGSGLMGSCAVCCSAFSLVACTFAHMVCTQCFFVLRTSGLVEKRRKVFGDVLRQYLPGTATPSTRRSVDEQRAPVEVKKKI